MKCITPIISIFAAIVLFMSSCGQHISIVDEDSTIAAIPFSYNSDEFTDCLALSGNDAVTVYGNLFFRTHCNHVYGLYRDGNIFTAKIDGVVNSVRFIAEYGETRRMTVALENSETGETRTFTACLDSVRAEAISRN